MLDGLSCCPLTSLELTGGIPHSESVSKTVAARCPRLTELTLDYESNDLPGQADGANGAYAAGVKSLLRKIGPRLRKLTVKSAQGWPSEGVSALRVCTALTSLHFHTDSQTGKTRAAWRNCWHDRCVLRHACVAATQHTACWCMGGVRSHCRCTPVPV